jgi:hypothetical protein
MGRSARPAVAVTLGRRWGQRPARATVRRHAVGRCPCPVRRRPVGRTVRRRSGGRGGHGQARLGYEVPRDAEQHVERDALGDGGAPDAAGHGRVPTGRRLVGGRSVAVECGGQPGLELKKVRVCGLPRQRAEARHGLLNVGGAAVEASEQQAVVAVLDDVAKRVVGERGRLPASVERCEHGQLGQPAGARRPALRMERRQRPHAQVGELRLAARLGEVVGGVGEVTRGRREGGREEEEDEEVREGSCHVHGTRRGGGELLLLFLTPVSIEMLLLGEW